MFAQTSLVHVVFTAHRARVVGGPAFGHVRSGADVGIVCGEETMTGYFICIYSTPGRRVVFRVGIYYYVCIYIYIVLLTLHGDGLRCHGGRIVVMDFHVFDQRLAAQEQFVTERARRGACAAH